MFIRFDSFPELFAIFLDLSKYLVKFHFYRVPSRLAPSLGWKVSHVYLDSSYWSGYIFLELLELENETKMNFCFRKRFWTCQVPRDIWTRGREWDGGPGDDRLRLLHSQRYHYIQQTLKVNKNIFKKIYFSYRDFQTQSSSRFRCHQYSRRH